MDRAPTVVSSGGSLSASPGLARARAEGPAWARPRGADARGRLLRRFIAAGLGISVFLFVASVVDPKPSPAADPAGTPALPLTPGGRGDDRPGAVSRDQVQRALLSRPHPEGWPSLGLIEGTEYYLLIHGSPNGPRYTVCTLTGRILQADLPADEVYRAFPTVDVEGMRLEPAVLPIAPDGPALMLAEPRE